MDVCHMLPMMPCSAVIINIWFYSEARRLFSFLILKYKLNWQHLKFNVGDREGRLPPAQGAAVFVEVARGRSWGGGHGFPSPPVFLCSLAYPLASHEPPCQCVCIYFQLLLSGSKISLSWTGPTLGAWNVLMLRLALHIWHILSISDNSSRAHRKQTNEIHRRILPRQWRKRGRENLWGDLKQRACGSEPYLNIFCKMNFQGHSGSILGSATNIPILCVCAFGAYSLVFKSIK